MAGRQPLQQGSPGGTAVQHLLLLRPKQPVDLRSQRRLLLHPTSLLLRQGQCAAAGDSGALAQQPEGEGGEAGSHLRPVEGVEELRAVSTSVIQIQRLMSNEGKDRAGFRP